MKKLFLALLIIFFVFPSVAFAQVHERPITTVSLAPGPISPGSGLSFYQNPVTVTLNATADSGYTVAHTYYKINGGTQLEYTAPFNISNDGKHSIEFWSIDNTGIEELTHKSIAFTIGYQHGVITNITQNGNNMDISIHIDNIQPYLSYIYTANGNYGTNCWDDSSAAFEIYNAETGERVAQYSGGGSFHCGSLGDPNEGNQWLVFPPMQLPSGIYFIHYSGGTYDWITENYSYTAPIPHNHPTSTISLSPDPTTPGNGLSFYSEPVLVNIDATADIGYSIANIYYKIDGGAQQTYNGPFIVSGIKKHTIEYWAVDNAGLEQTSHNSKSFTLGYQAGEILSIAQNGNNMDISIHIDNIQPYLSYIYAANGNYGTNCWDDGSAAFEIYNAVTGTKLGQYSGGGAFHCGSLGDPNEGNQWLVFPPMQLPSGIYFIHYSGGPFDWITNNFEYTAPIPPHSSPETILTLSPEPNSPGSGLTFYSDPVTVTLNATADSGYSIANTYYKIDGGTQQSYTGPFTISGTGKHHVEYWSIDNSGLSESTHRYKDFIIGYQHGIITSITQNGISIQANIHIDNIQQYLAYIYAANGNYGTNCWDDGSAAYELYNANTGVKVSQYSGGGAFHCGSLGDPSEGNQWLVFPPLLLPAGTYFIHYSGGTFDWVTDLFVYTPTPTTVINLATQNGDGTYSNPTTVSLSANPAVGTTLGDTYYRVDNGTQETYSGPFTIIGGGQHTIEYWSVDNSGVQEAHKTESFTIYLNQAPVVDPFAGATINTGQTYSASSSFTDPDSSSWTATVDYDDGAGEQPLTLNPDKTFSLSHQYNTAGTYHVTVVVRDNQQATGTTQATVVVENASQTIGNPTPGDTEDSSNRNFMNGTKFTVGPVGGAVTSMSVYVGDIDVAPNNEYQMAIYTNKIKSNGDAIPGTLIAQTAIGTFTGSGWNTLPITATFSPNTTYWLLYNTKSSSVNLNNMYMTTAEPEIGVFSARTFGTWPTNYPNNPTLTNQKFSIYASMTPSGTAPTVLAGNTTVESNHDQNTAGSAEAFKFTALSSGNAQNVALYLSSDNAASQVRVGIYTDNNNNPGTLLAQTLISTPVDDAWNTVSLPTTNITAGTNYWVAILSPQGSGIVRFRDKASGGTSVGSQQNNLTTLPATWTTNQTWTTTDISAYLY